MPVSVSEVLACQVEQCLAQCRLAVQQVSLPVVHAITFACLRGHRTRGAVTSVSVSVRRAGLPSQAVSGAVSIGGAASLAARGHAITILFTCEEPARAPHRLPSWSPNAGNSHQCR